MSRKLFVIPKTPVERLTPTSAKLDKRQRLGLYELQTKRVKEGIARDGTYRKPTFNELLVEALEILLDREGIKP